MSYNVDFSSKAKKFLKKLQKSISLRILDKFEEIKKDPFRYLEHYEGDSCYKFRIGDYRALIDVNFEKKILWTRVIDKRGKIYKR
jgi:mRNA interferase RelE/StbE